MGDFRVHPEDSADVFAPSVTPGINSSVIRRAWQTISVPLVSAIAVQRMEEMLRESEDDYRQMIDSQTELICRSLPDTTITCVNDAYCRYFDRKREDLVGMRYLDLIPESSRENTLSYVRSLTEKSNGNCIEHEAVLPNGQVAWQH